MIIKIKVKPNSGKQEIVKVEENEYLVCLKQKAEDNEANTELIKLMKKYFKKDSVEDIKIIKGLKGRNKILEAK